MQVQKEAVRGRIIAAARTEFMARGFKKASMRSIAARARITPGNIYAYFPGKEALFAEIVGPVAAEVRRLCELEFIPQQGVPVLAQVSDELMELFSRHGADLPLLLMGGAGSSFELSRERLTELISQRIRQHMIMFGKEDSWDPLLGQAWSQALLAGLLTLLHGAAADRQRLRRNVDLFLNRMFPEELR